DDHRRSAHRASGAGGAARLWCFRESGPGICANRADVCADAEPARSRGRPVMTERLTAPDELTCYFDRPAEPANIHLEARIGARLDEAAIRAAVSAVLNSEPRILARRTRVTRLQRWYSWEFAAAPETDPVMMVRYADPADLDRLRDSFLSRS